MVGNKYYMTQDQYISKFSINSTTYVANSETDSEVNSVTPEEIRDLGSCVTPVSTEVSTDSQTNVTKA